MVLELVKGSMTRIEDLIGKRSTYQPLRTWLHQWASNNQPSFPLVIITGDAGVGKTTLAITLSEDAGFYPQIETDGDYKSLSVVARKRTFTGDRRVAILDNADHLSKKIWNQIERSKDLSFPLIIICSDPNSISWNIRRSALSIHVNTPTPDQIQKFLIRHRNKIGSKHSDQDLMMIASRSISWRSAKLSMITTPPNMDLDHEIRKPRRVGRSQIGSILSGSHNDSRIDVHPMALISTALWNGSEPDHVEIANILHSLSWNVEGLSKINHAYLTTLRTISTENPPFRTRKIDTHRHLKRVGL